MGRIKSGMIRKAAKEIVDTTEGFNTDFENNKKLLKGAIHYKSVRNKVAGAIIGIKKKQLKKIRKDGRGDDGKSEGSGREEY